MLVIATVAWASPKDDDFFEGKFGGPIGMYYYYIEDNEAVITNFNASEKGSANGGGAYESEVTIPSSVTYEGETYPVVGIQDFAFYNCPDLVVVNIPNTIQTIGQSVFRSCPKLTRINVAQDSPFFHSIDGILYDKFNKELIALPANAVIADGKYNLQSTVTSIRDYAMT